MSSPTTQLLFLSKLCHDNPEAIVVSSIGTISYDLAQINHPYRVMLKGAMGAALGCGLGIALSTTKQVIVVIGDGSYLMKMGSISTILRHNLPNLRIIVINNNSYASCGGQSTNFHHIRHLVPFEVYEISPHPRPPEPHVNLRR